MEYPGAFLFVIVPLMAGRTKTAFILPHIPIDILRFVWYNKAEVRAMLIDSVVQKEAVRNEQMILQYESLIEALPKGSIACRKTDTTILDTERTASCTINILVKILR